MRGDIETKGNYDARTQSEAVQETQCFGFNILKAARMINLVVGVALSIVCTLRILDLFKNIGSGLFSKLGIVQINVFLG